MAGSMTSASAKQRAVPGDVATRHIGFCAICERDIKLDERGLLVHHGYQRPGDGRIHGDCFAVGAAPYEVSADVLRVYHATLVEKQGNLNDGIVRLRNATYFERYIVNRREQRMFVRSYSLCVTPWFEHERDALIRERVCEVEEVEREIVRVGKWIDSWAEKAVRTVEEVVRAAQEKKSEARARVEAARAERAAKRAAIDAKHAERAAREEAEKQAIIEEVKRLHAEGTWARNAKPVIKLAARIRRNKKAWTWIYKAGIDNELVALGLAYRSNGYIQLSSSCI